MTNNPKPPTSEELEQVDRANESGKPTVVFVHGLWLLAGSWDPWRTLFESAGQRTVAPDWPDDPSTVEQGRRHPELFAGKSIQGITDHVAQVIKELKAKPAIVGHSFGGLITQKLAGQGLAHVSVPIDRGPFRGVIPLHFSSLKAASAVLRNPLNRKRSVMLPHEQFRFAFVNAVDETEAKRLYDEFPVPGSGIPLFQAAFANVNPSTEARVDSTTHRGPMKIISGEKDHTVPWAIASASFERQRRNAGVIDSGWEEVALREDVHRPLHGHVTVTISPCRASLQAR